ncbi:MAG: HEPN domain-containing protein [Cyanobacteria bacterium J06621_11]
MNEEQTLLIAKAKESLQAARLLSDQQMYGFSASRAYYSMFYVAQAFLIGENLTFSSHSAVISSFGKVFAKTKRLNSKFHRYLIDAAQTRTDGDYSTARTVTAGEAFESISQAQEFIQLSNKL